jgi:hypothetical protein
MPGRSAWPGRGRVSGAGQAGQFLGVHRIGRHHLLPLWPLGVADPDGDRAAQRATVPDAADDVDLVRLELHPGTPAVAEPTPGQLGGDVGRGDLDIGHHALQHRHQGGAVRFSGGDPAQHGSILPR